MLGVVFCLLGVFGDNKWTDFPVPDNYMQVVVTPDIVLSWGFYVACVGTLVAIVALVFAWIVACQLCNHIEGVRYQMLNAPLTEEEKGSYLGTEKYRFEAKPPNFRYDGYSRPGQEANF